jgi:ABC-type transport system substrate-binding protein
MPLGRAFTLPKNARWSGDNGAIADARDVRGTLQLLTQPGMRERWPADGLEVFEEIDRVVDPFKLRLAYRQGVLEPLSRATFKVIPWQYLHEQGKGADDEGFARQPFGTGPYRYEGREREPITRDGVARECAVFRANPHYGKRAGKFGLPWIREIRFFVPDQSSIASDVASGQLHLYPDAPSEMAPRFAGDAGIKDVMRVSKAATNRRIHILSINHRKAPLQNDKLRQGLSAAINREAILKDVRRGGDEKSHTALTGPFPVRSWATPSTARNAPLYKPGAGGLILEGLGGGGNTRLRLMFVVDDPKRPPAKNAAVCQAIKAQIEQASVDKVGRPTVEIELMPRSATEFRDKLVAEHDYDLALTTFDYRDDLYSLASLLDPEAAERHGRNYMGYLGPGTNPTDGDRRLRRLIEEARQYRDFSKQVKEKTWDIHALFNQRLPFIPLWQLDRFTVVHKDLEMYFDNPEIPVKAEQLDPAVVFTGVEMWRLK